MKLQRMCLFFAKLGGTDSEGRSINRAVMAGFSLIGLGAILPQLACGFSFVSDKLGAQISSFPTTLGIWMESGSTDDQVVRIIVAALALTYLGVVVLRRKGPPEQ